MYGQETEMEKRMDIIGQNGNTGEHYEEEEKEEYDVNKDGVVDDKDIKAAKQKISELQNSIEDAISTKS